MNNKKQEFIEDTALSNDTLIRENAFFKQEVKRLHKELSILKGELLKQKASNKDRIIKQLQRENAKLRRKNRNLFNMSKGTVRKVVRQTCAKVKIKNTAKKAA
jgi:hypothetical protein